MIAVDDDEPGTNAQEGGARGFVRLREPRRMARELDRGTEERGGERVRRKYENGLTAHVVIRAGGSIASLGDDGCEARAQQEGDQPTRRSRDSPHLTPTSSEQTFVACAAGPAIDRRSFLPRRSPRRA